MSHRPSHARSRTALALALALALAGGAPLACSATPAHTAPVPPLLAAPAPAPVPAPAPAPHAWLRYVGPGARAVVHLDLAAVMQSPYGELARRPPTDESAVHQRCGEGGLSEITDATLIIYETRLVVVRGAITAPEREPCARALWDETFGGEVTIARRGDAMALGDARALAHFDAAAQTAGPPGEAARTELFAQLPAQLHEGAITAMVAVPRLLEGAQLGSLTLPGMSRADSDALVHALRAAGATLELTPASDLDLSVVAQFESAAGAAQARDVAERVVREFGAMLRAAVGQPASDPERERLRQQISASLDEFIAGVHVDAQGADARIHVRASPAQLGTFAGVAIPMFVTYSRRAKTAEARANVARLASAMSAYLAEPRRRPRVLASAPRTPAEVPRGVRVVDGASTWEHPTWRALGFALADPHYYSYEVQSTPRGFAVRAIGDLDGDGQYSTFERSGTVDRAGHVTLTPDLQVTNELE